MTQGPNFDPKDSDDASNDPDVAVAPRIDYRRIVRRLLLLLVIFVGVYSISVAVIIQLAVKYVPPKVIPFVAPIDPGPPWVYKPDGMETPKYMMPSDSRKNIPLNPSPWFLMYPKMPSSFVMLRNINTNVVMNLQTGKTVGAFDTMSPDICLSPDGKRCAVIWIRQVEILDTANGNVLERIFPANDPTNALFSFAGNKILLVGKNIIHLDQKTVVKPINIPFPQSYFDWDLTATGRHLAVLLCKSDSDPSGTRKWRVNMYELETGGFVGQLNIPVKDKDWQSSMGLAISRNGKKLCCAFYELISKKAEYALYLFDLQKGELIKRISLNPHDLKIGERHNGLEWTPNEQGILIGGRFLLDHEMETVVWDIPQTRSIDLWRCPRLSGEYHMVVLQPTRDSVELQQIPLPPILPRNHLSAYIAIMGQNQPIMATACSSYFLAVPLEEWTQKRAQGVKRKAAK